MFLILGWSFVFCGKMEVVRPRPIQSAAVFFKLVFLKQELRMGEYLQVSRVPGLMIYKLKFIVSRSCVSG